MKRLLICTPTFATTGGVERILQALNRLLPERGFHVVFGLARGSRFHDPERYRSAFPGLEAVEIDGTSGTRPGRWRGLQRTLDSVRPDVVVNARLCDVYPIVCEQKARHAGSPRLVTLVQTYEPEYLVDARAYAQHIDLCVAGGLLTAAGLIRWSGLAPERVCSIPGGITTPLGRVERDPVRTPLRLGYVGRLEQNQKRIRDLPEVLRHLDQRGVPFEMRLVGTGPEEAWLRERLDQFGLAGRVAFRGWVSTEELYQSVYPDLDVFLHMAQAEGAPIALAEALVHGVVPVVSEFTGCLTEGLFVHEHNALLFPVGRPDLAARQVERLHADRLLLKQLSDAAAGSRNRVLSPEEMADRWAEALTDMLARPPAGAGIPPVVRFPPSGRLERWGLPPSWGETLRRWCGRRAMHVQPGSEWPHWSGLAAEGDFEEIARFAVEEEARHRREPVASA